MPKSTNWKNAEKHLRDVYLKYNVPAERILRSNDYSRSDYDVRLTDPNIPVEFTNDSKYSASKPFRHHGLLKVIAAKYCKEKNQFPVLFTKNYKEQGGVFSVPEDLWAGMVAVFFNCLSREDVLKMWGVE